jgi:hypothetical protein
LQGSAALQGSARQWALASQAKTRRNRNGLAPSLLLPSNPNNRNKGMGIAFSFIPHSSFLRFL